MEPNDAQRIWQAGVNAAVGDKLVRAAVSCSGDTLNIGGHAVPLSGFRRLLVIGGGKAAASMAVGLEQSIDPILRSKSVAGLINVPQGTPPARLSHIKMQTGRAAGSNLPTEIDVQNTRRIAAMLSRLGADDLCIGLISGGGSALLSLPSPPVTVENKASLITFLDQAGATIEQINVVRRQISQCKGGRLAAQCRAGRLINLILSDIPGDPLDLIASGPTVPSETGNDEAQAVLRDFDPQQKHVPAAVYSVLETGSTPCQQPTTRIDTVLIGNNRTAVEGAVQAALALGYSARGESLRDEGAAEQSGKRLVDSLVQQIRERQKTCLVSGGEPTVRLSDQSTRGMGGRNQQLVLAALQEIHQQAWHSKFSDRAFCLLSGGTDGEDGTTTAAGAWVDGNVLDSAARQHLNAAEFLKRNDSFHFFQQAGGLFVTGPTGTNVCDLRVVLTEA